MSKAIRLKRAYLFQEIKCGSKDTTSAIKTFFDEPLSQEYRGTMLQADMVLIPEEGLIYIREKTSNKVHITTINNLKSCIPYDEDVPNVWESNVHNFEITDVTDKMLTLGPVKKRQGRPPKEKVEGASNTTP